MEDIRKMSRVPSSQKHANRRKKVEKQIRIFKEEGVAFTSLDIAKKCNLRNAFQAGQIIKDCIESFNLTKIKEGVYQ